jgi:hypothetical protein
MGLDFNMRSLRDLLLKSQILPVEGVKRRDGCPCRVHPAAAPGSRHGMSRAGTGEASIRRVIPAAQAVANAGVRAVGLIGGE